MEPAITISVFAVIILLFFLNSRVRALFSVHSRILLFVAFISASFFSGAAVREGGRFESSRIDFSGSEKSSFPYPSSGNVTSLSIDVPGEKTRESGEGVIATGISDNALRVIESFFRKDGGKIDTKDIAFHGIKAVDMDSESVTSRAIRDKSVRSEDLSQDISIDRLTVDGLTVEGATDSETISVSGNVSLSESSYINWGNMSGEGGLGFREHVGKLQFRNDGGGWMDIGSGSGGIAIGNDVASSVPGSIFFAGVGGTLSQDNGNLFWNATDHRLGIGTGIPSTMLEVNGVITATGGSSTYWNAAYGWGNHATAGYLASSSYTASDVLSKLLTVDGTTSGLDADTLDGHDTAYFYAASNPSGYITDGNIGWDNTYGFLTSYSETDPVFAASSAYGITGTNIANWNQAYGWGNHATAGYLASSSYTASDVLSKLLTVDGSASSLDADTLDGHDTAYFYAASNPAGYITDGNIGWDNTYGFITDPNDSVSGSELDGVFSMNGILRRTASGTYSSVTDHSTDWNQAYGWGNHATAGYLASSSYTASDVLSKLLTVDGTTSGLDADTLDGHDTAYFYAASNPSGYITDGNIGWDNTYGFLTSYSETDPVFAASSAYGITGTNIANWNQAYGWGNHATAGYLTGITGQSIKNLSDVYSSMTPADGQVLTYDTTNGWQAETLSVGISVGDTIGSAVAGSVFFAGASGVLAQDNANLFWDSANHRLGLGTTGPTGILDVRGGTAAAGIDGTDINLYAQGGGAGTTRGGNIYLRAGSGSSGWPNGSVEIDNASAFVVVRNGNDQYVSSDSGWSAYPSVNTVLRNDYNFDGTTALNIFNVRNANANYQYGYFGAVSTSGSSNYAPTLVWGQSTGSLSYQERMRIDGNGNVGIGTASPTDRLTVGGNMSIAGNIVPAADDTYALGSPTRMWKDFYVGPGSIYVNGQKVLQTDLSDSVVVSADTAQNLIFKTTGGGNVEINPAVGGGQLLIKSNINLTGGKYFDTTDHTPVNFTYGIATNVLAGTGALTISAGGTDENITLTPSGTGRTIAHGIFGLDASSYLNFGSTYGSSGYGFRDDGGVLKYKNASGMWTAFSDASAIDHGSLSGLLDDDHTQYALLAGRSGGQTLVGGSGVTDVLKLQGTSGNGTLTSPAVQVNVGNNGATTALTVLNNGNVGIGTTTPVAKLVVYSTASSDQLRLTTDDGIRTYKIGRNTSNGLLDFEGLQNGSTGYNFKGYGGGSYLYIQNAGNVGINTTTPTAKLQVKGNGTTTGVNFQTLDSAGTALITGLDNGNVGIGTTSPGYTLDVNGTASAVTQRASGGFISTGNGGFSPLGAGLEFYTVSSKPLYFSAGASGNNHITILSTGNVGIGTTAPAQKLDVASGNIRVDNTTYAAQYGVLYKGSSRFLHDFNYGLNGNGVTTGGGNLFLGVNAGNFTMGSTATQTYHGSYNTGIGDSVLVSNTTGFNNSAVGYASLRSNTTGNQNFAIGTNALYSNTTGSNNSAIGTNALYSNTTGSQNSSIGYQAGRYLADGSTANATGSNSLFLGSDTRANGAGQTNQIVIGDSAIGLGSNTVVLGNDSIVSTALRGNVGIGLSTAATARLQVKGAGTTTGVNFQTLDSAGTALMTGLDNGNVGIGTTSPGRLLSLETDVSDSRSLFGMTGSNPTIYQTVRRATEVGLAFSMFDLKAERTVSTPTTSQLGRIAVRGEMGSGATAPYASMIGISVGDGGGSTWYNEFNFAVTRYGTIVNATNRNIESYANSSHPSFVVNNGNALIGYSEGISAPTLGLAVAGNVGINTTSPTAKLQVKGAGTTTGVNFQTLDSAGTALITGLDNGNVGIGTTSPGAKLHLYTASSGSVVNLLKLDNQGAAAGTGTGILFENYDYNVANIVASSNPTMSYAGSLLLTTRNSSNTWNTGMTIDGTGNVGIGTTSPEVSFQIGDSAANVFKVNSSGNIIALGGTASAGMSSGALNLYSTSGQGATFKNNASASGSNLVITGSGAANGFIDLRSTAGTGSGDYVKITGGTNGSVEVARFLGTGNVGINTTSPTAKLQVKGNGTTTGVNFQTLDSAGTALITGLDNGNVGIGTTSPSGRLTVANTDTSGITDFLVNPTAKTSGNLIDLQVNGTSKFKIGFDGAVTGSGFSVNSAGSISSNGNLTGSALVATGTGGGTSGIIRTSSTLTNIGDQVLVNIAPVYNQSSGAASNTDLLINRTETSVGSGAQYLINAGTGGGTYVSKFNVTNTGQGYFAGNVGINTTTPSAKLQVKGAGTTTGVNFQTLDSAGTALITGLDNGNVGIGTTSPEYKLDVVGGASRFSSYVDFGTALRFSSDTGKGTLRARAGNGLSLGADDVLDRLFIATSGNVGIGTTSPGELLDVNSSTTTSRVRINSAAGYTSGIKIASGGVNKWYISNSPSDSDRLRFLNASDTDTLSVLQNGNVGINITSPTAKLQVKGAGTTTGVNFQTLDSAGTALITGLDNGNVGIGTSPTVKLDILGTNTVTDSTGNVFVHTSNAQAIDVGGYIALGGSYNDAGSQTKFAGIAGRKENSTSGQASGYLSFSTSSVSGGTLLERMRITSTGNVGIGTTSPGYALDIAGTASTSGIRTNVGIDLNPVVKPTFSAGNLALTAGGSNLGIGTYYYSVTYLTALGETNTSGAFSITTDASNRQVTVTVPVSSDPRVTGRRIYRSAVGGASYSTKVLTTISDNTTASYVDDISDGSLTGNTDYFRSNTTSKYVMVNGSSVMSFSPSNEGNLFFGYNTGNATLSNGRNVGIGQNVLRSLTTGTGNMALGVGALQALTTGGENNAMGYSAGQALTTGASNTIVGHDALYGNKTGNGNTAIGAYALFSYYPGYEYNHSSNTAIGASAMNAIQTGGSNTAIGVQALYANTTGSNNIAIGVNAGRYLADGSTGNQTGSNSLFIGNSTRANGAGETNQIVIGYNAIGLGSNTVVLGNDSIVTTALKGNVGIGTTSPSYLLHVSRSTDGDVAGFTDSNGTCTINPTSTALICSSDRSLKKDIVSLSPAQSLDLITSLDPVSFRWKKESESDPSHIGLIAQDVQDVLPSLVSTGPDGKLAVNYLGLVPYAVSAIQGQQEEIDSLSFRLDTLDLSTGKTATTLGGLQSSVDAQLDIVGDALSTLGKDADSLDGRLSALDSRVLSIESDITDLVSTTNGQDTRIGDLEEDMALLRDEHEAVMGFFSSFNLNLAVMKDEEGNVDLLGGKLSVRTLSTGELEIEVVDSEAPTLGTATLYPVAKDKDDDGLDDYTGLPMSDSSVISRDGKSMTIRTKAVSKSSRIFITPDVAEPIAVTERRTGKDFTVSTSDVISEKIRFDWMIVREREEVGGEADANGGR